MNMVEFMNMEKPEVYNPRSSNDVRQYKRIFQFEVKHINLITEILLVENNENRGRALPTKLCLEVFQRYVIDPGFQIRAVEDLKCLNMKA